MYLHFLRKLQFEQKSHTLCDKYHTRLTGSLVSLVSRSLVEGIKVFSSSSSHCMFIHRNQSSIGVSDQSSIRSDAISSRNRSSSINTTNRGESSNGRASCSIGSSLGSKVFNTSSSHSWLINRNQSSIRMANQLSVQVESTSIGGDRSSSNSHR